MEEFVVRSRRLMEHARNARSVAVAKAKQAKADQTAHQHKVALQSVVNLLPGASILIGRSQHSMVSFRRKTFSPMDFILLTRALFMRATSKVSLGVKLRRLLCMGARFILHRQTSALQTMLVSSQRSLSVAPVLGSRSVHAAYIHLWDEVQTKFKAKSLAKLKHKTKAVTTHTMVQRGVVSFALADVQRERNCQWSEYWLCQPLQVDHCTAEGLYPAIAKVWPRSFAFDCIDTLSELVRLIDSYTFMPVGDKASSNVSILKHWGHHWEHRVLPQIGPKILFWADSCGIHLHHRAKMQVKSLKFTLCDTSPSQIFTDCNRFKTEWLLGFSCEFHMS